ncbi:MAG: alpha-amylase family glycosyl hydrolase [Phycisphaerales bacterium]
MRGVRTLRPAAALAAALAAAAFASAAFAIAAPPPWPPVEPAANVDPAVLDNPGVLPPSIRVVRAAGGGWSATFRLVPAEKVASVALAGDFNGWNTQRTPMQRTRDGAWEATVPLKDGTTLYKFVLDGSRWIPDPRNPDGADDGHGGRNSRLVLGPEAALAKAASTAAVGDGRITAEALLHAPSERRFLDRGAASTVIRVRTLAGDVQAVELRAPGREAMPLRPALRSGPFQWWEGTLGPGDAVTEYTFVFQDGDVRVKDPGTYALNRAELPGFTTPEWAKHAIWYQVMVDRFRNGDPSNDPSPVRPWRSEWYAASPWEGRDGQTFWKHFVFERLYGGDLAGLEEKLPYLKELGVNALYLMPIFQAPGPHKYNGRNYLHVDEHFGATGDYEQAEAKEDLLDPKTWTWTASDRRFLAFLGKAKSMGFRVIIDGVFNHTGTQHPAFKDVKARGKASPYSDWYEIKSWDPFDYDGWWGFKDLPVFRKDDAHGLASASLRKHILDVTTRWMDPNGDGDPSDGVDGWRLDVPNEVPLAFWKEWRRHVKRINPEAYISGEIWTRADQWLDGSAFDAVMNYEFAKPALAWIANRQDRLPPSELDRRLAELRMAYPSEATYALQNLVDSHDTDRVASMIRNPDRPYNERNREQEGHPYDSGKPEEAQYRRQRLLALLQMTGVGAPMIYYGDEAGMWGAGDPGNRKPMLWKDLEPYEQPEENAVMEDHLAFYRGAIALRNRFEALRTGSFRTILTDDGQDLWVFLRESPRESVLVALNAGERAARARLPAELGSGWTPAFGETEEGGVPESAFPEVEIPPVSGRVWVRTR